MVLQITLRIEIQGCPILRLSHAPWTLIMHLNCFRNALRSCTLDNYHAPQWLWALWQATTIGHQMGGLHYDHTLPTIAHRAR